MACGHHTANPTNTAHKTNQHSPQHDGDRRRPSHANTTNTHVRAYDLPNVPALVAYLHATAGFPVKSTWLEAVKRGAYTSWPGLTYELAARYCPDADKTIKGHMAQPRQHIRSTKQPTLTNWHPPGTAAAAAIEIHSVPINRIFTEDTGRFTPRSRSGNQYIMIALHTPSNAILVQPFASKHDAHRIPAYNKVYERLATAGCAPTMHILDNEASAAFQRAITSNNCKYQLVPPHVHRRNAAKRAIHTFKDHFLAILAGVAPTFPRNRWDLLLPQAELTLNLLCPSATSTSASAWDSLFGTYNFDATPMGPAGSRVIIHSKAALRRSWDFRGHDGFYVGPALQHYRCYRVLNKESHAVTISHAIKFCHHYLPSPRVSTEDKIIHALQAINNTLARSPSTTTAEQLTAIQTLRDILQTYRSPGQNSDSTATTAAAPPGVLPPPGLPAAPPGVPTTLHAPAQPPPGVPPVTTDYGWTEVQPRRQQRTAQPQTQPPEQAVASRTQSRTTNAFALLAEAMDDSSEDDDTEDLALPVLDVASGQLLEHRQLRCHPDHKNTWDTSYTNELGQLCQGIGKHPSNPTQQRVVGTDSFRTIYYQDIPHDRRADVTYPRVVCEVRPQKEDMNRTHITIGGNRICYPGDTGTKTGLLELVKLVLNSVLSTRDGKFACFDLKNFYLGTPLDRPEYVRIKITDIPQEFIDEYDLNKYAHDGWVYFEINKGVYGLKQAGKLANDLLTERLAKHGYYQCDITPGLWRHQWRPILFVLIVDDFGVQYQGKRHAEHLLAALQNDYEVTTDWTGTKFAGIDAPAASR